jgi:hypothetical protein
MATSSILGGDHPPMEPKGTDVDSLGPSDTSDSGSDVRTSRERTAIPEDAAEGAIPIAHDSSTDAEGTGEGASADAPPPEPDAGIVPESPDDPYAGRPDQLADADIEEDETEDAGDEPD